MEEMYRNFAQVYDALMDNVPYEAWFENIRKILITHGIDEGLVLDLGCGTGTFTELMAGAGFDMIGVDASADMLSIAMEKRERSGYDILYLQQDMREFELYGTVRAIVSICDSMNYLTEPDDFLRVLKLAENYLDYNGIFVFDLNTEYKYRSLLNENTFAENRDGCSFIWENDYDPEERINEYALTLFVEETPACYHKYKEVHYQRAYANEEVLAMIRAAGLDFVDCTDVSGEENERICFVVRKPAPANAGDVMQSVN